MATHDSRFARRAAPPSHQILRRKWLSDYLPAVALGLVVFVSMTSAYMYHQFEMLDHWNSPVQTGQAIVVNKLWTGGDPEGGPSIHWAVTLRLNGQTMICETGERALLNAIQPGDRVTIIYHTGKSGHIYLSHITQISTSEKRQVPVGPNAR